MDVIVTMEVTWMLLRPRRTHGCYCDHGGHVDVILSIRKPHEKLLLRPCWPLRYYHLPVHVTVTMATMEEFEGFRHTLSCDCVEDWTLTMDFSCDIYLNNLPHTYHVCAPGLSKHLSCITMDTMIPEIEFFDWSISSQIHRLATLVMVQWNIADELVNWCLKSPDLPLWPLWQVKSRLIMHI